MHKFGIFDVTARRQVCAICLAATFAFLTSACADRQAAVSAGQSSSVKAANGNVPAISVEAIHTFSADEKEQGNSQASLQKLKNADPNNRVTVTEVEAIAADADKGYVDGWIDGRDPRVFKSPYRDLTALQKAQFAMAYHDFVEKSDQNLAQSYKTYIPYKTRAAFARHYWENSELAAKFKSSIEKMQIAWIHESLLDGSELWWRAAEKHFGNAIDSITQMAHDTEQNMVSKYMEDEGTESTFSQQMSVKTHAK